MYYGLKVCIPPKFMCVCALAQLCLKLCNPKYSSPSGSSVDGIFQARILESNAVPSSRDLLDLRIELHLLNFLQWQADSLLLVPPRKYRCTKTHAKVA